MDLVSELALGMRGHFGSIGLYGAVQRLFVAFGCLAFPGSALIDAPFGRFGSWGKSLTVNGNWGWFIMEAFSPMTFLYALAIPPSISSMHSFPLFSPSRILSALFDLSPARQLLAALYLVHYAHRSVIGTLRNPGRAPMHIVIPVLSALFNIANGGTIGMWLAGGGETAAQGGRGLLEGKSMLFLVGVGMWALGFVGNIYHDEVLYSIKREKQAERAQRQPSQEGKKSAGPPSPSDRYAIPRGGLYRVLSHPSYACEWFEWLGFLLSTTCLVPAPFPPLSASSPYLVSLLSRAQIAALPRSIQPLSQGYLQPPALFLLQEVAAMLPRARSGHAWYRRTFGKEWEETGAKWIVVPGVY
ncbi:uncharacterized protein JCM10292_003935 [Rhodotorula paludigena]|uniref:uncharacterized protein n=1 Tax=Rhodotorula paludigena TaxID=86838 RepID=UPI003170E056